MSFDEIKSLEQIEDISTEEILSLSAPDEFVGERLDRFLTQSTDQTRSFITKLIENGMVLVNGKVVSKNYKLRKLDEIEVRFPEPEADEAIPENIPLDIIYEDNDIIVINKPSGMIVHPEGLFITIISLSS